MLLLMIMMVVRTHELFKLSKRLCAYKLWTTIIFGQKKLSFDPKSEGRFKISRFLAPQSSAHRITPQRDSNPTQPNPLRVAPPRKYLISFGHCPFGVRGGFYLEKLKWAFAWFWGGQNACQDGLGHLFLGEMSKYKQAFAWFCPKIGCPEYPFECGGRADKNLKAELRVILTVWAEPRKRA